MSAKNNIEEILTLAKAADDQGHSATAHELFQRVIALDPGNDRAIYRAVRNLLEVGRISDAESLFLKIRRNAAPNPWLIEVALGKLRLAQFKPAEAEKHFRMALQLQPNSTTPSVYLADCLISLEKFNEANGILMQALKIGDDLEEVYLNLGFVSRAIGDYAAARNYFSKALEIIPDYPSAKRGLADVEMWLSLENRGK